MSMGNRAIWKMSTNTPIITALNATTPQTGCVSTASTRSVHTFGLRSVLREQRDVTASDQL